jgi:hypothetical protein
MRTSGGTGGKEQGASRALVFLMQLLWSKVGATTSLHREQSSARRKDSVVRFSGVVSAKPICEIGRRPRVHARIVCV